MRMIHFCIMAVILMLTCLDALASPNIQFSQPQFDFGVVYQGEKVGHAFEFVNAGQDPLVIDRVRSSCGCTAVLVSEKNLAPGETGHIQANFDSSRFRGDVSKTIYLYSNDPVKPVLQLTIKGNVRERVAVEPAQVNFGAVSAKKTLTSRVVLRNQGEQSVTLGKPSTTAKELKAEISKHVLAEGEEVSLELMLTPKPGTIRFSGYVIVPVEGAQKEQLRIPVYASVRK